MRFLFLIFFISLGIFGIGDYAHAAECTGGVGCKPQSECEEVAAGCTHTCSPDVYCLKLKNSGGSGSLGPGGTSGYYQFPNPFKYDTFEQVVSAVLSKLQGLIVLISLVFIIIGAVLYITSSGNEKMITLAKGAIVASMIGLAIGIAAPTFLKEIYDIVGGNTAMPEEVEEATPIYTILMNTLNFLLAIIGTLSIIMLVIGGMLYLFSGGSETKIETGKKIVVFSIIGLTAALISLIAVRQIALFFSN